MLIQYTSKFFTYNSYKFYAISELKFISLNLGFY